MSSSAASARRIPPGAIRVELPNVVQRTDYTCGAACLVAIAAHFGVAQTEQALVDIMRLDARGSDPAQLLVAIAQMQCCAREHRPMTDASLRARLDARRPVMLMLQAWGARATYVDHWTDGHWVVAIGYDRDGVYFEDPMIEHARGWLAWSELAERWHDLEGADDVHVERYGLEIWRPRVQRSAYARTARRIE